MVTKALRTAVAELDRAAGVSVRRVSPAERLAIRGVRRHRLSVERTMKIDVHVDQGNFMLLDRSDHRFLAAAFRPERA